MTRSVGRPVVASRGRGTGRRVGSEGRKEFLVCNPKEYDGKGSTIVYTRWIEKMELVQDIIGCGNDQKVKYTVGSFVRMVAAIEPKTIQKVVQIANTLTDEAFTNVSIKKNPEKRGNRGEPIKDRNVKDENKRTRAGNAFATTTNSVERENIGTDFRVVPRNMNPINAGNPIVKACYECGSTDHIKSVCPRLNRVQGLRRNRPNQVLANNGGQGGRNQGNQASDRAFILGAKEARQDPNIMMDFPEVFPNDLYELPPSWEIEFHIDLVPEAMSVA
nr:reverse transcriptase domain-containing protein [Tanacetum cinerariifolium]